MEYSFNAQQSLTFKKKKKESVITVLVVTDTLKIRPSMWFELWDMLSIYLVYISKILVCVNVEDICLPVQMSLALSQYPLQVSVHPP